MVTPEEKIARTRETVSKNKQMYEMYIVML